ncbi:MAG: choice-of-anchor B family protein [Gemmatimonadota bacterium]
MPRSRPPVRIRSLLATLLLPLLLLVAAEPAAAQTFGVGFGASTAVMGDQLVVGQPGSEQRPGTVFVFGWTEDGWSETARISAEDGTPGDRFGYALGVSGDELIVGAPRADDGRGAAYVFRATEGGFEQTAKLEATGDGAGSGLGIAVAIEDGLALAGTYDVEILSMRGMIEGMIGPAEIASDAPAVHAFTRGDGGWAHAGTMTPDEGEADIGFGHALALVDGTAYVGAAKRAGSTGAVFIFGREGGAWSRTGMIEGETPGAGFGRAILAMGSDRLLVGAPLQDGQQGQALVMTRDATSGEWSESARLRPDGAGAFHFGYSLSSADQDVWIGGLGGAFTTSMDESGAWATAERLAIEREPMTEFTGTNVALAEDFGVVGFPEDDVGAGTATILARTDDGWRVRDEVYGELDGLPAVAGEEVLCRDGTAGAFDCARVDLLAFVPSGDLGPERGVQVSDVWGWTDPETGREYAIVGRNAGTAFVDVTDASNPVHVATLPRTEGSPASLWRDVKTYRNYALVVADGAGQHGVQIFDLTRLRDIEEFPATVEPDVTYDGVQSSHNIIVNEETGFAYAIDAQCGGGLHMIDLSDPLNPEGAGCVSHQGDSPMAGFSHDSQCVVYRGPDADYQGKEICFTSALGGLLIQDVSDRDNPATIGVGDYPDAALPHQGWLTEDQRHFLMGDEGDEFQGLVEGTRTMIWDVTELNDPVLKSNYIHPTQSIDHNMYVVGDLVYQANYDAGLRILDISDIDAPREVGFFDTVPFGANDEATWRLGAWSVYPYFESGTIIVSSGGEGLFLLRYSPRTPVS